MPPCLSKHFRHENVVDTLYVTENTLLKPLGMAKVQFQEAGACSQGFAFTCGVGFASVHRLTC